MTSLRNVIGLSAGVLVWLAAGVATGQEKKADKHNEGATTTANAEVGKPAPAFELKGADGKTYKLSDYKDKIVVIDWFNRECPVCKAAEPMLSSTAEKYAKQGIVFLAIDSTKGHKAEDNAKYATDKKITRPILMDADGKVGHAYGAKTTPHIYIVDKTGNLVYMGGHDNKGDRNYIAESLDAMLAGKPVPTAKTENYGCAVHY